LREAASAGARLEGVLLAMVLLSATAAASDDDAGELEVVGIASTLATREVGFLAAWWWRCWCCRLLADSERRSVSGERSLLFSVSVSADESTMGAWSGATASNGG